MGQIAKGLAYVKSVPCVLKINEMVALVVGCGLVGYFFNEIDKVAKSYEKKGNVQFYLFASIAGWMVALAFLVIFVVGLHQKIKALPWTLVVAIVSAVLAILLLVSSALLAAAVKRYDERHFSYRVSACDGWDEYNTNWQCWQLIGGTVVGFIGTVLYAVDTVLHARMFLTDGSSPVGSVTAWS